ncbi:VanZ family protein [Microvirga puerhi]|uniref:VanZ family protein n=1 Tax=Microvirga puerhi TaxID=2876078 RepID=A0ABS7VUZ9_9HYPH|nr:VanZ family protein [Microvirga puerhi]
MKPTRKVAIRFLAWLLIAAISIVSLVPIGARPVSGAPANLERVAAFMMVGCIFRLAYPRRYASILLMLIVLTGALELLQNLVPSRHGRFNDLIVKVIALMAGSFITGNIVEPIRGLWQRCGTAIR